MFRSDGRLEVSATLTSHEVSVAVMSIRLVYLEQLLDYLIQSSGSEQAKSYRDGLVITRQAALKDIDNGTRQDEQDGIRSSGGFSDDQRVESQREGEPEGPKRNS